MQTNSRGIAVIPPDGRKMATLAVPGVLMQQQQQDIARHLEML